MRKTLPTVGRLALVMAIILSALVGLGATTALAQQTQFQSYTAGIQVANLSTTNAAVISLNAFKADGTQDGTALSDTIDAGKAKTYFPISNVSSGFSGSVVIGSSQSVAGIVNLLGIQNGQYVGQASYVGRSSGGTTVLLPLLNKDNGPFTTWYSVQNAGGAPATVNVKYSDGINVGPISIPVGAAHVFYQRDEAHPVKNFSGTVTGDQPLVASVVQESNKMMVAYTGFNAGAAALVFPLVNVQPAQGIQTGIQVQNAGNAPTEVTLSYTPIAGAGTACTEKHTINPGEQGNFALAAFAASVPADPAVSNCAKTKFVGSARVSVNSTNQPLVGIVNQLKSGVYQGGNDAFSVADAGKTVVMPLIMDNNGKDHMYTGFNVQNIGTNPTTVQCTFQASARTVGKSLQPGEALNDVQNGQLAPSSPGNKYVGSATCTGDAADSKLVAVVNEYAPTTTDSFLVYEGVKP